MVAFAKTKRLVEPSMCSDRVAMFL